MKKKNKGRKSITAVGTVLAAGLTPGIASVTPATLPPSADVELTAADAVSINGEVLDFNELFAMNQINRDPRDVPKVYGPPPSISEKEKAERDRIRRERARQDSIDRLRAQKLVYGPPPPRYHFVGPVELRNIAARDQQEAINVVVSELRNFCSTMVFLKAKDPTVPLERRDITRDLQMDTSQLEIMERLLDDHYGVQATKDQIKQLGTLEGIARFIVIVATPIKED